jgi:hypothetical protein
VRCNKLQALTSLFCFKRSDIRPTGVVGAVVIYRVQHSSCTVVRYTRRVFATVSHHSSWTSELTWTRVLFSLRVRAQWSAADADKIFFPLLAMRHRTLIAPDATDGGNSVLEGNMFHPGLRVRLTERSRYRYRIAWYAVSYFGLRAGRGHVTAGR